MTDQAINELLRAEYRRVQATVVRLVKDSTLAEDAVRETFVV